ncbi:MAG: RNA methyltransferase [Prevotellaceae bacterium]|jgi:tRNA G18 (ribose-2'-O)-methylase SpoU|nr:RNA methyltransferase [Prevotellaceae bacterium]
MPRKLLNSELSRLTVEEFKQAGKLPLVLVLDNIRSQHNIGAAFRTADAFRIEKIYLCGISSPPPSAEIHKAALGAEDTVAWHYEKETMRLITRLREKGYSLIAIEQVEGSVLLHDFQPQRDKKYALIFGNEVKGVQQQVVDECDISLEIPQQGTKHSLNVSVSIGVVLWDIVGKLR